MILCRDSRRGPQPPRGEYFSSGKYTARIIISVRSPGQKFRPPAQVPPSVAQSGKVWGVDGYGSPRPRSPMGQYPRKAPSIGYGRSLQPRGPGSGPPVAWPETFGEKDAQKDENIRRNHQWYHGTKTKMFKYMKPLPWPWWMFWAIFSHHKFGHFHFLFINLVDWRVKPLVVAVKLWAREMIQGCEVHNVILLFFS